MHNLGNGLQLAYAMNRQIAAVLRRLGFRVFNLYDEKIRVNQAVNTAFEVCKRFALLGRDLMWAPVSLEKKRE